MKFFHQAVLLLVLGCTTGKEFSPSDDIENLESTERISGGKIFRIGDHPFMVELLHDMEYTFVHLGGGAILNERWIVTAAHLLEGHKYNSRYAVIVGLHNRRERFRPIARMHAVSNVVLHEKFNRTTRENDIALIKTYYPIRIDVAPMYAMWPRGFVGPINLPEPGTEPTGTARVIGWGQTKHDGELSNKLRGVIVPIIDRSSCRQSHNDTAIPITEGMICAGADGKGACAGDDGGPLFQTKNDNSTLIGILCYTYSCGNKAIPNVYTRVSFYVNWIEDVMKEPAERTVLKQPH